jgi:hypothetical protein
MMRRDRSTDTRWRERYPHAARGVWSAALLLALVVVFFVLAGAFHIFSR